MQDILSVESPDPSLPAAVAPPQEEWSGISLTFRRSVVAKRHNDLLDELQYLNRHGGGGSNHHHHHHHNAKINIKDPSFTPHSSPPLSPSVAVGRVRAGVNPAVAQPSQRRGSLNEASGGSSINGADEEAIGRAIPHHVAWGARGRWGNEAAGEAVPAFPPYQHIDRTDKRVGLRKGHKRTDGEPVDNEQWGKRKTGAAHKQRDGTDSLDQRLDSWLGRGGGGKSSGSGSGSGTHHRRIAITTHWSHLPLPFTCTVRAETNASMHHVPVFIYDGSMHISLVDEQKMEPGAHVHSRGNNRGRGWGVKERLSVVSTTAALPAEVAGLPPDARRVLFIRVKVMFG